MRFSSLPRRAAFVAAALLLAPLAAVHAQVVLYDGSGGQTPGQQGWTPFFFFGGTQTAQNGATTLDTSASNNIQAGYQQITSARPVPLFLDRNANGGDGFTLRYDLRVGSETHASNDRAGFSLIVIASDKQGIELSFWQDEIWAQNGGASPALFTHGEGAAFDTTLARASGNAASTTRYDLKIAQNRYFLYADGQTGTPILNGSLRDYSAFTGLFDPYETPNFLWMGDDTTSARGTEDIAFVSVTGAAAVTAPEPGTLGLLLLPVAAAVLRRRR